MRERLLKANSRELEAELHNASRIKGGNEFCDFEECLKRDVIAYTCVHFFFMFDCSVFGGFVASHHSGLPWSDIDILTKSATREDLIVGLPNFITFTLGLRKECVRLREHSYSHYGRSFDINVKLSNNNSCTIKIDLTQNDRIQKMRVKFLPVTLGSCLLMNRHGTHFRNANDHLIDQKVSFWNVPDVVDILRRGEDVKIAVTRLSQKDSAFYREYYWYRITKKQKYWKLLHVDGREPEPFTPEKLELLVRRMTQLHIARAR